MMSPYLPIVVMVLLASAFVIMSIAASHFIGPRRYNRAKYDAYESGTEPTPEPAGGGRFPIKYFIIAMIFLLFDIETVFIYSWAVAFDRMGLFGLLEMGLFIAGLFIAYIYVWRRRGLDWQ